jgi:hypothetical protein
LGVEVIKRGTDKAFVAKLGAWESGLELSEPGEGVVVEVVSVLEDVPGNACVLVDLSSGFPRERIAVEAAGFAAGGFVVVDVGVSAFRLGLW